MGVGVHPSSLVSIRGTPPAKLRTGRNPKKAMQCTRWQVFAARDDVIAAACEWVVGIAAQASRERGIFRVVLSGGNTPQPLYRALAQRALDWERWHVYFADERCLQPGHPDSNAGLASANLLSQVPIPPSQVFPIVCGEDGPSGAARAYSTRLAGVPEFDLVLLGLGEDGRSRVTLYL